MAASKKATPERFVITFPDGKYMGRTRDGYRKTDNLQMAYVFFAEDKSAELARVPGGTAVMVRLTAEK